MLDTSLRDKPVAVCGSVEERHGIYWRRTIAKAHGIITGEAVWQAKRKCRIWLLSRLTMRVYEILQNGAGDIRKVYRPY